MPGPILSAISTTVTVLPLSTRSSAVSRPVRPDPMTATFLLPLATGACVSLHGESQVINYAYGLVAMVAMTPLLVLQLLGLVTSLKAKAAESRIKREAPPAPIPEPDVILLDGKEASQEAPAERKIEVIDL